MGWGSGSQGGQRLQRTLGWPGRTLTQISQSQLLAGSHLRGLSLSLELAEIYPHKCPHEIDLRLGPRYSSEGHGAKDEVGFLCPHHLHSSPPNTDSPGWATLLRGWGRVLRDSRGARNPPFPKSLQAGFLNGKAHQISLHPSPLCSPSRDKGPRRKLKCQEGQNLLKGDLPTPESPCTHSRELAK